MTVKISKPAINVREELADLKKPTGIAGEAMLRAETPQEQFNLIGAGRRNLIINGAMQVAQRGTSATSVNSSGYYTVDRFSFTEGSAGNGTVTMSQENDAPEGFGKSVKFAVTDAATLSGGQNVLLRTRLEGQNLQQLKYGTSNAQSITLSFWVKSSLTGTYTVGFNSHNTTASSGIRYFKGYTINATNTWEYKTLTIPAQTTNTIDSNKSQGLDLEWMLDSGPDDIVSPSTAWANTGIFAGVTNQVNFMATSGATWQITGVQLELGKVATPFEHRSYGEELAACHRYFQKLLCSGSSTRQMIGAGHYNTSTALVVPYQHYGGVMRGNPTGTLSALNLFDLEPFDSTPTAVSIDVPTNKGCFINCTDGTSRTVGFAGSLFLDTDGAFIAFDAEL
jgi:hypothetical protein